MSAQPLEDTTVSAEIEAEIEHLIETHGGELAALRALLRDFYAVLADADRASSRGYLRGLFSAGARPERNADA